MTEHSAWNNKCNISSNSCDKNNNEVLHVEWLSSHRRLCLCFLRIVLLQSCRVILALHKRISSNSNEDEEVLMNKEQLQHSFPETTWAYRFDHFRSMFYGDLRKKEISKSEELPSWQKEEKIEHDNICKNNNNNNHERITNIKVKDERWYKDNTNVCTSTHINTEQILREASREVLLTSSHLLRCSHFDWDALVQFINSHSSHEVETLPNEVEVVFTVQKLLQQTSWVAIAQVQLSEFILHKYKTEYIENRNRNNAILSVMKEEILLNECECLEQEELNKNEWEEDITRQLRIAVDLTLSVCDDKSYELNNTCKSNYCYESKNIKELVQNKVINVHDIIYSIFPKLSKSSVNDYNNSTCRIPSANVQDDTLCTFHCPHVWFTQFLPHWLLYDVTYNQHSIVWCESRLLRKCFQQWRKKYGLSLLKHLESNNLYSRTEYHHHHQYHNEEQHNAVSGTKTNITTATNNNYNDDTSQEPKIIKSYESDEIALNASSIAKVQEDENNSNHNVSSDFIQIVDHVVNDENSIITHELCKTNDLVETIIVCDETNNESGESVNIDNTNKESEEEYNINEYVEWTKSTQCYKAGVGNEHVTASDGNYEETIAPLTMHAQANNNHEESVLKEHRWIDNTIDKETNVQKTTRKEEANMLHCKVFSSRAIKYKKQDEEMVPLMDQNSTAIDENTINKNNNID